MEEYNIKKNLQAKNEDGKIRKNIRKQKCGKEKEK